jgi:two-component system sensor histidine kinase BarA
LWAVLLLSFAVVFVLVAVGFVRYDTQREREDTIESLLEESRMFAREMDAVWGFMDNAQYTINNSQDGYQFKGLHCAIVGKSVGAIFSKDSDYTIRYTNFEPRNSLDYPDEYEAEALTAFADDPNLSEYYGIVDYQGQEMFRYVRALEVDESCLECHGDPAGELDITGHAKEGWTLDSLGGAISIVIPVDWAIASERSSIVRDAMAFLLLVLVVGATVIGIVTFSVMRPLGRMKHAFADMQGGQLGVRVGNKGSVREIAELTNQFNAMSDELNNMYRTIERQVEDRTLDLQQANEVLERQRDNLSQLNAQLAKETQFKTDLLSMVNHELRTPLTAIITLAQISEELADKDTAGHASWVEVENNSRVLLGMINDMLDIARSDAGMITATRDVMDLGDILASVRQSMTPIAMKYKVDFSARIGSDVPLVMGDFEKTIRIMVNLVSNAVKFTPDGGCVRLSIDRDVPTGQVRCSVSDNGIGIALVDQLRIFDRFVQVDSTSTRKYPGSGLGLAIVKEYAELQGFDVELESALGEGSRFTLVISKDCVVGDEDVL